MLILSLVIALGVIFGKLKVSGISLGVTGILFVGIAFGYFGMNVDEHLLHFMKEFGLDIVRVLYRPAGGARFLLFFP